MRDEVLSSVEASALDHVALWVAARAELAAFIVERCGMHEVEVNDQFTLLGGDARLGKLTLFDTTDPPVAGPLARIVLRVPPGRVSVTESDGVVKLDAQGSIPLALVERDGVASVDLDHVVLRVPDPAATANELGRLGFERLGEQLRLADKHLELVQGNPPPNAPPLLNHLGLLVDSAERAAEQVRGLGLEVDELVDTENTRAVFVWGPERIKLEYIEHKPGFSLV